MYRSQTYRLTGLIRNLQIVHCGGTDKQTSERHKSRQPVKGEVRIGWTIVHDRRHNYHSYTRLCQVSIDNAVAQRLLAAL